MNRLIVNADDFGLSTKVNDAIINCIETGTVSSTTAMANGPMVHDVLNSYNNLQLESIWCSTNFNHCRDLDLREIWDYISSIQRDKNNLFPKDLQLLSRRLQMQINVIRKWRRNISHADSHHHVHNNPAVLEIIVDLCRENNIPSIRRPYALTPWQRLRTSKKTGVKSTGRLTSDKKQAQKSLFKKVLYEMNAMARYNDSLHLLKSFKTTDHFFSVATSI